MKRPTQASDPPTQTPTVRELPATDRDSATEKHPARAPGRLDASRFPPGAILARRYRMVSFLGRGGMGDVYRADDLELGQAVALKFLPESMARDEVSRSRLRTEVRIAREISHPNVCRVHDIGEAEGHCFLSMEYIEGEDLASLHRRIGRLPRDKALEIARQLCQGLAAAHERDVLHRDLKPSNLMIDGRGRARITDFGIATLSADTSDAGEDGSGSGGPRQGTPAYMAPEQLTGGEASVHSDLFALGLVLYELFTGQRAFQAASISQLIAAHQAGDVVPPSDLVPGFDPAVEAVILGCLRPEPDDRPGSVEEVASALSALDTGRTWRPAVDEPIPQRPSWLLEEILGEGGFGQVWLARHNKTGDPRVFKFCHEAQRLPTLQREIAVFRLLKEELGDRDDIARVLDWSFEEPPYFIESEYTEGGNLQLWCQQRGGVRAVPLAVRLELVAQVATALAAAHSVGVLHKDVKPSNVLITGDAEHPRARLTDFGLGAVTESQRLVAAGITSPDWLESSGGERAGTRLYMAPELVEGKAATLQSDLYALGVMLYQAVVGDFSRVLAPGWWRDVDDELLREDIGISVDGSPERRLGDARRLARRLRSLEDRREERDAGRRAEEEARQTRKTLVKARRRRRMAAALAGALAVIALAMGFLASLIAREKGRAEEEAARARNLARIAVAGEWMRTDPTRAALVLLEVEDPDVTAHAGSQIRRVLERNLAAAELRGHEGPIRTAEWSLDGERIVTTSGDRTARVWQTGGSGEHLVLEHDDRVLAAWFDRRDGRVVTVSADGVARYWNPDGSQGPVIFEDPGGNLELVARAPRGDRIALAYWSGMVRLRAADGSGEGMLLAGHGGPVTAVSFSADGTHLVTAARDGTARIWRTGEAGDAIVLEHGGAVTAALFGPGGNRVLTAAADGVARVWSADSSGEPIAFRDYAEGASLVDVSWSPAGDRIALSSWGTASVRSADGSGDPVVLRGHRDEVAVSFSPSGDLVLTTSGDGTTRIWSADSSAAPVALDGHDGSVDSFFSPNGGEVLTTSRDGSARLWRVDHPTEPAVLRHAGAVQAAAWSPAGDRVVTAARDGSVKIWGLDGDGPVLLAGHDAAVAAVAWSPAGDRVLTASHDGTARVWSADRPRDPAILAGHDGGVLIASWNATGDRVLTASEDGTVRLWRPDGTERPVVLGSRDAPVFAASWSPDGDRVALATSRSAGVWSADGAGATTLFEGHDFPVEVVSFDPGGNRLLTASGDGTARIWNVTDGEQARLLDGHDEFIFAASFSPSGDRVLTATADGVVRIWDADLAGEPLVITSHRSAIYAASWSPDGDRIVTASEDGTARVRDADGAGEPLVLEGHAGPVIAASWSPLGDRILTLSLDGTARVWRTETADLIAAIKAATGMCLDPEFRRKNLDESPEKARLRHAECERSHGREPAAG